MLIVPEAWNCESKNHQLLNFNILHCDGPDLRSVIHARRSYALHSVCTHFSFTFSIRTAATLPPPLCVQCDGSKLRLIARCFFLRFTHQWDRDGQFYTARCGCAYLHHYNCVTLTLISQLVKRKSKVGGIRFDANSCGRTRILGFLSLLNVQMIEPSTAWTVVT